MTRVAIAEDGWATLASVAAEVGMTTRQIDYWRTCDYIECEYRHRDGRPVEHIDGTFPGSGYASFVSPREAQRIRVMAALVQFGMDAAPASLAADELVSGGGLDVAIGLGLRLVLDQNQNATEGAAV